MALSGSGIGTTVAGIFQSMKPTAGSPVTETRLQDIWIAVMDAIYTDIKANAEVLPNTFEVLPGVAVLAPPPTGVGATTAPGIVTGEGKIT